MQRWSFCKQRGSSPAPIPDDDGDWVQYSCVEAMVLRNCELEAARGVKSDAERDRQDLLVAVLRGTTL